MFQKLNFFRVDCAVQIFLKKNLTVKFFMEWKIPFPLKALKSLL